MSDILDRLRDEVEASEAGYPAGFRLPLIADAAVEIEALRAELDRIREVAVRYESPPHEGRDWSAVCGDAIASFRAEAESLLYIGSDDVNRCLTFCFPSSNTAQHLRNISAVCATAADVLEGKVTPEEPEGGAA